MNLLITKQRWILASLRKLELTMSNPSESQRHSLSLSIRSKFILINLTCLFQSLSMPSEQFKRTKLESLERAATENLRSSVDLLTLRRHEKISYLARDNKYAERFDKTANTLNQRLVTLNRLYLHTSFTCLTKWHGFRTLFINIKSSFTKLSNK